MMPPYHIDAKALSKYKILFGVFVMPMKQKKFCIYQGCSNYAIREGYCEEHIPKTNREYRSYERWYGWGTWKRIRAKKLRECPLCEECRRQGRMMKATDVDHIIAHKGNWKLFTNYDNLQSLCHSCHSEKTSKEINEGRGV